MINKKKISWITPSCYIDVDLPIVKTLQSIYKIHWIVILQLKDGDDVIQYVKTILGGKHTVDIHYFWQRHRFRSLKNIFFIWGFIKTAKSTKPDIIYISEYAQPFGVILYKLFLPFHKTIAACHNVTTPQGANNERFMRIYTDLWIRTFKNIQTFSQNQYKTLISRYKNKNVLMAYLAIKDYGEPSITRDHNKDIIRFLVFGNIVHYKRIDLLIKAANILYERGIKNFKIKIAGNCKDWNRSYAPLIGRPELFELAIKRIPNGEVANLFINSDYFVMPYQDIAQSGAITVAFRYNIPVICSDIEQFNEFVTDGVTGFTFCSKNETSLANKMEWIIKNNHDIYERIKNNQRQFVEKNFSISSIVDKYKSFINKL